MRWDAGASNEAVEQHGAQGSRGKKIRFTPKKNVAIFVINRLGGPNIYKS